MDAFLKRMKKSIFPFKQSILKGMVSMKNLSVILVTLLSLTAYAGPIQFDLIHTKQECQHEGYQPTFCDGRVDQRDATDLSGMVENINAQIERAVNAPNPSRAYVYLAYFSFSNKLVHSKLCEAIAR